MTPKITTTAIVLAVGVSIFLAFVPAMFGSSNSNNQAYAQETESEDNIVEKRIEKRIDLRDRVDQLPLADEVVVDVHLCDILEDPNVTKLLRPSELNFQIELFC